MHMQTPVSTQARTSPHALDMHTCGRKDKSTCCPCLVGLCHVLCAYPYPCVCVRLCPQNSWHRGTEELVLSHTHVNFTADVFPRVCESVSATQNTITHKRQPLVCVCVCVFMCVYECACGGTVHTHARTRTHDSPLCVCVHMYVAQRMCLRVRVWGHSPLNRRRLIRARARRPLLSTLALHHYRNHARQHRAAHHGAHNSAHNRACGSR